MRTNVESLLVTDREYLTPEEQESQPVDVGWLTVAGCVALGVVVTAAMILLGVWIYNAVGAGL